MNHFLRLTVISVLVFLVMTAYCVLPKSGRNTVIASKVEKGPGTVPGFKIFIECDGQAQNPLIFQWEGHKKGEIREYLDPVQDPAGKKIQGKKQDEQKNQLRNKKQEGGQHNQTSRDRDKSQVDPPTPPVEKATYKIKKGDTLLGISKRLYGNDRSVEAIKKANPGIKPNKLVIGRLLTLPEKPSVKQESQKKKVPLKPYKIKAGDTFYSLAEDVLGDGKAWRKLWRLNQGTVKHYNRLRVGMKILLPVGTL